MMEYYNDLSQVSRDAWYDTLEELFIDEGQDLSEEDMDDLLHDHLEGLSYQEAEGILQTIGKIAKSVGKVAAPFALKALQATPVGMAGTALAGLAKNILPALTKRRGKLPSKIRHLSPQKPIQAHRSIGRHHPRPAPRPHSHHSHHHGRPGIQITGQMNTSIGAPSYTSSTSANQLAILIQNPHLLNLLLQTILGRRSSTHSSSKSSSLVKAKASEIFKILAMLANRVGKDWEAFEGTEQVSGEEHLEGEEEEINVEDRAEDILNSLFLEAEIQGLYEEHIIESYE